MTTFSLAAGARRRRGLALLVAACLAALALVAPAQAATTFRLTGTVSDSSGHPLVGIDVTLGSHPADEDEPRVVGRARTDSSGRYTFKAVPAASEKDYYLSATDPTRHHVETFSSTFALTKNTTRNLTLEAAGFVQGQVSTKDGAAAAKPGSTVRVTALKNDDSAFGEAKVAANGRFRIGGLPAGTYVVQLQDTTSTFEGLCYDDVPWPTGSDIETCATTTPVVVRAGAATTLKPQVLDHRLGVVNGTVDDVDGDGIARVTVQAYGKSSGDLLAQTRTDADGVFVLKGLVAGKVRLRAIPADTGQYRPRWYRDASSFATATVLTMKDGGEIANLRIPLPDAP